ncbi:hypothetical protein LX16_4583 [Stackebrandtia albiflava]|uniref:Uncharacterized protein n=1 Tax=Stackebrandtia albiflava TaxID=406432 RepID=A0A562URV3_9ACTN|nr:hypothetical protein [Stackebrandtia albiflava]TWJ08355.1 hypothetical protein LX16_4583 [Stackebrandtia albiflava]
MSGLDFRVPPEGVDKVAGAISESAAAVSSTAKRLDGVKVSAPGLATATALSELAGAWRTAADRIADQVGGVGGRVRSAGARHRDHEAAKARDHRVGTN